MSTSSARISYRPEIDGLRAIAVLPVLFFHAGHPWFEGGFLGVDVFFVISGYLIAGWIISRLVEGRFSLAEFYDRRARRILPALTAVLVCSLIASPLFMLPNDLKTFGQSLVATVLSANNILLYLTSGYWSPATEFKPLSHTWSLGVEEQFYLVIPLLLVLAYWLSRKVVHLGMLLLLLLALSTVGSYIATDPEFNFLMLFTRAWELLAGGLVSVFAQMGRGSRDNVALSLAGIGLIGVGYFSPYLISDNQLIVTLSAVAGTVLVILYCRDMRNPVYRALSLKCMVFIGLLSYSIYLWHQPLLAFFRLANEYPPGHWVLSGVALGSLPLAWVSWKYIERPARDRARVRPLPLYACLAVLTGSLLAMGLLFHVTYGFESRGNRSIYGGDPRHYVDRVYQLDSDRFSDAPGVKLVVVGDSFARDVVNATIEYWEHQYSGIDATLEVIYKHMDLCAFAESHMALVGEADFIVHAMMWGHPAFNPEEAHRLAECVDVVDRITEAELYVIGGKNFGWNANWVLRYRFQDAIGLRTRPVPQVLAFNRYASGLLGDRFVDVLAPLLDDHGEVPLFTPDGYFITYDNNHLTPAGALFIGEILYTQTGLSRVIDRAVEPAGESD